MTDKKSYEELCVIISIVQDMYTRIVGSYKIKIEGFIMLLLCLLVVPLSSQCWFSHMSMSCSVSIKKSL